MKRGYPRLGIVDFGRHLLKSGDLDPIYIALNGAGFPEAQRNRWLTAYCAYYHAGVACYMSELPGEKFWQAMMTAATNADGDPTPFGSRWPRGHERRHFRGGQAEKGIAEWRMLYGDEPEAMFAELARCGPSFTGIRDRALGHRSIGTWLSFKVVDLVDACMGVPVDQSDITPFFYDTPKFSLLREWRERMKAPVLSRPKDERRTIIEMNNWLATQFIDLEAPHKPGHPVDNFCLETIWCKHQSHLNGHYPLNNDIDEINAGLEPWREHSRAAAQFMRALPARLEAA